MKLQEFIGRLQAIERSTPGKDIAFETVELYPAERRTMQHHLLSITPDESAEVSCTIQLTFRPPQRSHEQA